MQLVTKTGVLGEIMPVTQENLELALSNPHVDHVHVFEGTEKNIRKRTAMIGKKYTMVKRFQKTGGNSNYHKSKRNK